MPVPERSTRGERARVSNPQPSLSQLPIDLQVSSPQSSRAVLRFAAARCPDQASPFAKRYQSRVVRHAKGGLEPTIASPCCHSFADPGSIGAQSRGFEHPNLVYHSCSIVLQVSPPQSCSAVARCVAARHPTIPSHSSQAMSSPVFDITTIVEIDRSTHSFGVSNPPT